MGYSCRRNLSALALKESLEKEDPKVIALPRVMKNEEGKDGYISCQMVVLSF